MAPSLERKLTHTSFNFNSVEVELSSIVGVSNEVEKNNLFAYPNPTEGVLHLSSSNDWELFSVEGFPLHHGSGNSIDLEVLGYQKGVYLILIEGKVQRVIYK